MAKITVTSASGGAGAPVAVSEKTGDYTLTAADRTILANAELTATLPSAAAVGAGIRFEIKNIHATAAVTVAAAGGDTLDGGASLPLASMEALTVVSDGAGWWAV